MNRSALATTAALTLCSLLALLPTGCLQGAELSNQEEFRQSVGCDMEPLLAKCGSAGCHEGDATNPIPFGGVDLFRDSAPADLVGMPATYPGLNPAECPTVPELIIDPSDPINKSLLLVKLRNEQSCGDGMPTPFDFSELPAEEIACFEQWVQQVVDAGAGAN